MTGVRSGAFGGIRIHGGGGNTWRKPFPLLFGSDLELNQGICREKPATNSSMTLMSVA
jgi:hypothetical protein